MRVTHDDGVELTFDNIVNDSSLYAYGSDVLNRIVKIDSFWKIISNRNILFRIGMLYSVSVILQRQKLWRGNSSKETFYGTLQFTETHNHNV